MLKKSAKKSALSSPLTMKESYYKGEKAKIFTNAYGQAWRPPPPFGQPDHKNTCFYELPKESRLMQCNVYFQRQMYY